MPPLYRIGLGQDGDGNGGAGAGAGDGSAGGTTAPAGGGGATVVVPAPAHQAGLQSVSVLPVQTTIGNIQVARGSIRGNVPQSVAPFGAPPEILPFGPAQPVAGAGDILGLPWWVWAALAVGAVVFLMDEG